MSIEGKLKIELHTSAVGVEQVSIASSRPVHAAKVFQGKPVREAQRLLPLLFSVCGTAQACASARACERAMGIQVSSSVEQVREHLVKMETLREHLWRILLDWPVLVNTPAQKAGLAGLLSIQNEYRQLITGGVDPFINPDELVYMKHLDAQQPLVGAVAQLLEQQVFGVSAQHWLEISSMGSLQEWIAREDTIATRMLKYVLGAGWAGIGRSEINSLPQMQEVELAYLAAHEDFAARPQWQERCYETTVLTRCRSPLPDQLKTEYANGLLVRLVARLTELAQLSMQLLLPPPMDQTEAVECRAVSVQNPGIGQVSAARGQLVHRIQLEGETIAAYQIVAPTEWNFHPRGVVAQSLGSLSGDKAQIEQQARLLINAIDPCVAFELGVN